MGRKIPAKKHRGVKDPLIQQARRLKSLKGKINAPPKDPDDQPVPNSLTQLFAFQNKEQNAIEKKKSYKKNINDGKVKPRMGNNPIAKLKQLPGESGRGFSLRINSAIRALNEPLDNLDYTSLQEEDGQDRRGERMAAQRERRQRKNRRGAKSGDAEENGDRPGRVQRLALKKRAQKEKAKEEASRPELVYDRVSFGDVTHAPPSISVLPRHCKRGDGAERPGRRQLLLTGILRGESGVAGAAGGAEIRERERQERARLDVVAAYRAVKKQRRIDDKKKRPHS